ncbi:MAG: pyridoxamine 5'-phosphate oxidase family protein [Candidatus Hodarchaeota archaeon]
MKTEKLKKHSSTLRKLVIPKPTIPKSIEGYNLPQVDENLLKWEFVVKQMKSAKYYWIITSDPLNVPHSVPVWGIWYEDRVFVGGSPKTKWVRNLKVNPNVSVHLPSPTKVCMIEGKAVMLAADALDDETWDLLDSDYKAKYQQFHGSPYICVEPRKVLAWDSEILDRMTKWTFE